ncbi:MAG: enoyl-CoA hydratase-related protein [Polyangiaceae bacterium]
MSAFETLLVEESGPVVTVTLNRPDKLNAINPTMIRELRAALEGLRARSDVRAMVLTGAGEKAFAAGADIQAMATMTSAEARTFSEAGHTAFALMETAPFPVIGAVNGFALGGGCELALCCDFLVASEKAKFGQPEVKLGVIPGFGGSQRLARRVGIGRARELLFTGDIVGADEAFRIGLVNHVWKPEELRTKATELATSIAEKGPLAVALVKRVALAGADVPLATANEIEIQAFSALFGSEDQREGMAAFLAQKKVAFKGR